MSQELFEIGKALSRIADVMEANQKEDRVVFPSASPNKSSIKLPELEEIMIKLARRAPALKHNYNLYKFGVEDCLNYIRQLHT